MCAQAYVYCCEVGTKCDCTQPPAEAALSGCELLADQKMCDADPGCSWCDSLAATPSSCHTSAQAKKFASIFKCNEKAK